MPVVYRWWMKYSDGKREHRVEEDREGREYRSEGARGARDINRSNRDRANIAFGSMVNGNNQELSMDMESSSLESAEQGEKSEPQNRESGSCQAKSVAKEGEEKGEEHVTGSGAHQPVNDVSSDERSSNELHNASTNLDEASSSENREVGKEIISGETGDEEKLREEGKEDFNESFTEGDENENRDDRGTEETVYKDGEVDRDAESIDGEHEKDVKLGGEENNTGTGDDDYEEDDYEGSDEENNESDNNESDDEDEQSNSYTYNTQQVFKISKLDTGSSELRYRFYNFIEKIAEEETKIEDPRGYDRYSMKTLMMRRYTKKPLKSCMVSRVRDQVVLILDNSGSMDWWKENILEIADVAMKRKDVEIYIAPNGFIESRIENGEEVPVSDEEREELMKMTGRTIIYVGDFDGADTPIQLSWRNKVYWFCPESRYRRFRSHDWVSYDEEHFKGVFVRCWNLEEFIDSLAKITNYRRMFVDYHEHHTFNDD
ncbi:MAG: hypothetical protein QW579_01205 [Desulfurococcaceae archaeon]